MVVNTEADVDWTTLPLGGSDLQADPVGQSWVRGKTAG